MTTKDIDKETINTDEVLFEIWCIMNQWDQQLVLKLSESIKSINTLKNKSKENILKLIDSIDCDSSIFNKNVFMSQIEELNALDPIPIQYPNTQFNSSSQFNRRYQPSSAPRVAWTKNNSEELIYDSTERGKIYNCMRILWCGCCEDSHKITTHYVRIHKWDKCGKITDSFAMENVEDITRNQSCCCCLASCCCSCCIVDFANIYVYGHDIEDNNGHIVLKNIAHSDSVCTTITRHVQEIHKDFRRNGRNLGRKLNAIKKDTNIGFSVGGAKDINAFRDNILKRNIVPQINAITFEGIFYDYYFESEENEAGDDTNINQEYNDEEKQFLNDKSLFYPSYCYAKSYIPDAILMTRSDHVTNKTNDMIDGTNIDTIRNVFGSYEYYLTVGLNSNIKVSDFKRKKLNLVIVLDVSGSMGSGFSNGGNGKSKMNTANECILSILTHLCHDDRFGLVLFDNNSWTHIPFQKLSEHKLNYIESIVNIREHGATDFEAGYNEGLKMYEEKIDESDIDQYENRMIFLTDACPNIGKTDPNSLMNLVKTAAINDDKNKRIYTTFVGIGLDFNADLIADITKVRGANYFAVHSSAEFFKRLDLEFDYIVSPMVFDLKLTLQTEGKNDNLLIDAVYGSNDIDINSGEIVNINTLFPSPPNYEGNTKGGIVLIKLKKLDTYNDLVIECCFEDKWGKKYKNRQNVVVENKNQQYYANMGIRKGILLTQYVLLMRNWIKNRGSNSIVKVTDEDKEIFKSFLAHFENEMTVIQDDTLKQEVKILTTLITCE